MRQIDYDGFMNESNRIIQKSRDQGYNEGIMRARSLVKRFCKETELERKVKTVVFNSNGHIGPDNATRQVLNTLPTEGLYDLLFGKEEDSQL